VKVFYIEHTTFNFGALMLSQIERGHAVCPFKIVKIIKENI